MESTRWSSTHEDGEASLHQVDCSFFNKIISRNSFDLSNRISNQIAAVPFNWESQPGMSREDLPMNETIRPINLPPALHESNIPKPNITHTKSRVSMIKKMKKMRRDIKDQAKHLSAKVNRYVAKGATNNKVYSKDNQRSSRPTDEFLENLDEKDGVFASFSRNLSSNSGCSSAPNPPNGVIQWRKSPNLKVRSSLDGMARIFAKLSLKKP